MTVPSAWLRRAPAGVAALAVPFVASVAVLVAVLVVAAPAIAVAAPLKGPETVPSAAAVTAPPGGAVGASRDPQVAALREALAAVEAAAADSTLALASYRAAAEARREAVVELYRGEVALDEAEDEVGRQRAAAARWVRAAYVAGGVSAGSAAYTLLGGGGTDDVATRRVWLERVSHDQERLVARLEAAVAVRSRAVDAAQRAASAAQEAATRAGAASAARDAALSSQRQRLADLELVLVSSRRDVAAADSVEARRAGMHLEAARRAAGLPSVSGAGDGFTGLVGECAGGDVSRYANGFIPRSALCPLAGAAGQLLRADAAYAFNRLSAAYAARFGRSLCVTDSYRSYDEQVRVRAERPGLAAVPGRSNHGWGTATDLCGGVERFGSPEHAWMLVSAPLFGWFHPDWARERGALPEPWHWEFSG